MNQQLKVLIVDDESELRRSVSSILSNSIPDIQLTVDEADNGVAALEKVKAGSWDLVLMDVKMPEMDGLEALVKIKEHDPRTFVVIMTAHSNLNDAVLAIKEGAYDYLEKPVKSERLVQIVTKALEARDLVSSLALSNPIFDEDVESEFVGILRSLDRWRMDGRNLVLRGDKATLVLSPASRTAMLRGRGWAL